MGKKKAKLIIEELKNSISFLENFNQRIGQAHRQKSDFHTNQEVINANVGAIDGIKLSIEVIKKHTKKKGK